MIVCSNCGAQQPDGSAFCGKCGTKLAVSPKKRICPHCNHELQPDMVFCDKCGTRYTEPSVSLPSTPLPPTSVPNQGKTPSPAYTNSHSDKPVANTGALMILSVICILLCWPLAIYGFYCAGRAKRASSQEEANGAIRRGMRACLIGLGIIAILFIIGISL